MGATTFYHRIESTNAKDSFNGLVEDAQYENGHGGYTGTIAEKSAFSMSKKPTEIDADEWHEMVEDFDEDDKEQKHYHELKSDYNTYDDKWGDALCIPTEKGFIFCGWASE